MKHVHLSTGRYNLTLLKIAKYAGIGVGALLLVCVLALLLFTDPLVNRFVKPKLVNAFAEAYPAYSLRIADMHYSLFTNRFGFDSVALGASNRTFSGHMGSFSVGGIAWMHLLWGGTLEPKDFAKADFDAQKIGLELSQSRYEFSCKRLLLSAADSKLVAESLELHPMAGDEEFFRGSTFRKTRLIFAAPSCSVTGLGCLDLLLGKKYSARSVQIHDASLDILVNKDKPDSRDTSGPFMPNEILSSIKANLQVNSLSIINGRLKYGERFELGAKPALITFDSMQVSAEGIANHGDRSAVLVIHAQGRFVKAGTMKLLMTIPVASPEFSFQYSGSLGRMDLSPINSFLEVSDHMRIKTGVLEGVTFEVNVVSGRASGNVSGVYRDLTLAAINKQTGSEKGLSDRITSFIGNTFKIRRNNVPGKMKIGKIEYVRVPDDPFIQFEWFALRTGVRDVLGF
jgi:hypothetical protein